MDPPIQYISNFNYVMSPIDDALRESLSPIYDLTNDSEIETVMNFITVPISVAINELPVMPKNLSLDIIPSNLVSAFLHKGYTVTNMYRNVSLPIYLQDPQTNLVSRHYPPYTDASDGLTFISESDYNNLEINDPKWINLVDSRLKSLTTVIMDVNNPHIELVDYGLQFDFLNSYFNEETSVVYSTNMKVRVSGTLSTILSKIKVVRSASHDYVKNKSTQLLSDVTTSLAHATDDQRVNIYYKKVLPAILALDTNYFDAVVSDSVTISNGVIYYSLSNVSFDGIVIEVQDYVDNLAETDPLVVVSNSWSVITLPDELDRLKEKLAE